MCAEWSQSVRMAWFATPSISGPNPVVSSPVVAMTRPNFHPAPAAAGPVSRPRRRGSIALALLVSALAALPMLNRVNAVSAGSAGAITVLALWSTWYHLRAGSRSGALAGAADSAMAAPSTPLVRLLLGVLPVWRQHVVTARTQVDEAVADLVTHFSSIADEFEAAGFKGLSGPAGATDLSTHLLALCERDLHQVIAAMNEITNNKSAMAASLQELSQATEDLHAMAQGVAQIAAQTNLLAVNAAIEAAHAGDSGRGFAIVAREIRNLSQMSAQTATQITERIERVTTVMTDTSKVVARTSTEERSAIDRSSGVVTEVLAHMRALSGESHTMRERGAVIRTNVEGLLVSLQFQDRVSQMIGVIEQEMGRLRDQVDSGDPLPAAEQWLDDLQRYYTMHEQRDNHTPASATASAPPVGQVVFF
jgi:methyl-accepting chemotaxis protein